MPKLSEPEAERRRQRIVEAALRCFAERGLHATSMADIFEAASTSAGSVYSWFSSKDEIIEAAYTGSGRAAARQFADTLDTTDVADALGEVLRSAARMFDDAEWRTRSRLNVQLWGEALVNPAVAATFLPDFTAFREVFAHAVRRGQDAGTVTSTVRPDVAAAVVWGLYVGLEAQQAWDPDFDHHAYAETAATLLEALEGP